VRSVRSLSSARMLPSSVALPHLKCYRSAQCRSKEVGQERAVCQSPRCARALAVSHCSVTRGMRHPVTELLEATRHKRRLLLSEKSLVLNPISSGRTGFAGSHIYWLGDLQSARSSCETQPDHWSSMWCLAVTYKKLGRHADAEAELTKLQATFGDNSAYQCATIYAALGRHGQGAGVAGQGRATA
jgi:hypothetical protein